MTSTPSIIPHDFFQKINEQTTQYGAGFVRMIFTILWTAFRSYLPYAIGIFFLISLWAIVKATMGRWGQLGSIIYHVLFFGFMGTVIAIKGWEILFNTFFDLISLVVYLVSFYITGLILRPFRRHY